MSDAPAVAAVCQDPEIPRWIPFVPTPYTEDDARRYVQDCIEAPEKRRPFAITDRESGRVVGSLDMRINNMRSGHVGYWVAADVRGRGVATAALSALARWAFDDVGLQRLELVTDPENRASQRVAEKVGFKREGVMRSGLEYQDGRRRDCVMFSLLPADLD